MVALKKVSLAVVLMVGAASIAQAQELPKIYNESELKTLFQDDFSGWLLNTQQWEINLGHEAPNGGAPQWGTWEVQKYVARRENLSVSNGILKITATRSLDPFMRDASGNPIGRVRTNGALDPVTKKPVKHINWVFSDKNSDGTYTCIDQAAANKILPTPVWDDGGVVLRCEKNLLPGEKGAWNSARITTKTDFKPSNGNMLAVEASIKLPSANDPLRKDTIGYWPAFWMLGSPFKNNANTWPAIGEIDIMENVNGLNQLFGTLHCGEWNSPHCNSPGGRSNTKAPASGTLQNSYHTYRMEWDKSTTPHELRWYLDGVKYHTVKATDFPPNLQIQKNLNTDPDQPGTYLVSWYNSDGSAYTIKDCSACQSRPLIVVHAILPPALAALELNKKVSAIDYWEEAFNKHGHNIILNLAMGGAWATPDANNPNGNGFTRAVIDGINSVGPTNKLRPEDGGGYSTTYEPAAYGIDPKTKQLKPVPTPWNSTESGKSMEVDYVKVQEYVGGSVRGSLSKIDNSFSHSVRYDKGRAVIEINPKNICKFCFLGSIMTFKYSINGVTKFPALLSAKPGKPFISYVLDNLKKGDTLTYSFMDYKFKESPRYTITK